MDLAATGTPVILAVVAPPFGSTRLPGLAQSIGQAPGEFEAGVRDEGGDDALAG